MCSQDGFFGRMHEWNKPFETGMLNNIPVFDMFKREQILKDPNGNRKREVLRICI